MRQSRVPAIALPVVLACSIAFAGCSPAAESPPTTTTAAAGTGPAGDTGADPSAAGHSAAELVEIVAAAPAPTGAVCVAATDLTSEGDVTRTARATYDDASGALLGQLTLQETEADYVDLTLANAVKRNSLDLDFPAVAGAKTRTTAGTPGSPTDGTPVAFRSGSTVVLLSLAVGAEAGLAEWAPAVDAYLSDQEPTTAAPVLPPC